MKTIKNSMFLLMAMLAFTFISCGGEKANNEQANNEEKNTEETTKENEEKNEEANTESVSTIDLSGMSEEAREALARTGKAVCGCFDKHGDSFVAVIEEIKPAIEEAKKSEDPMAAMGAVMGAMAKMQDFDACMKENKPNEEDEKLVEAEMEKMFEGLEKEEKEKKRLQVVTASMEECPKGQKAFSELVTVMEEMSKMSAQQ